MLSQYSRSQGLIFFTRKSIELNDLNATLECLKKISNGHIYDKAFLWK